MIENERQYRITKTQLKGFEKALAQLARESDSGERLDALKLQLHQAALRSQLEDLKAEIEEFDRLREGLSGPLELHSLDELPLALIRARIACRMSQKELALRLKVKEQQIQRYEATKYSGVSLQRAKEVMDALGVQVSGVLTKRSA